ncbi:unnamed protein product [Adineta ricciae]|uniref:Uncharacterized protein n=1 Tax=Adineta ricciae TaxID=249248 RepID=A0A815YRZ3_ADIRI|nr:unnamed protein product [Adineta ricciae]
MCVEQLLNHQFLMTITSLKKLNLSILYAVRFDGQLLDNQKHLVRQHSRTTRRAENLVTKIDKDEQDLPHPPVVAFPSAENKFKTDLGTEDRTVPSHEIARCFGCGAQLQCSDRTKAYEIDEQVYRDIQAEIKRKRVLIILIVDLLDRPDSISRSWTHRVDRTSQLTKSSLNVVIVLGNKVDLLPNVPKRAMELTNWFQKFSIIGHNIVRFSILFAFENIELLFRTGGA